MRTSKEFCLYCNSDLPGEPIPKQSQKAYGATHFTRKIGITSNETDRILNRNVHTVAKSGSKINHKGLRIF
ncbi:hypothetical protein [Bacillus thuringiensis]|uniref:hypothetical protein n=1 Tax=Bacillus thuringiensis TaxID=1428 RepID=UPI0020D26AA7|nr:hypothetical protein [Bacillus thuringiensis]